jgi:hypothetical protein
MTSQQCLTEPLPSAAAPSVPHLDRMKTELPVGPLVLENKQAEKAETESGEAPSDSPLLGKRSRTDADPPDLSKRLRVGSGQGVKPVPDTTTVPVFRADSVSVEELAFALPPPTSNPTTRSQFRFANISRRNGGKDSKLLVQLTDVGTIPFEIDAEKPVVWINLHNPTEVANLEKLGSGIVQHVVADKVQWGCATLADDFIKSEFKPLVSPCLPKTEGDGDWPAKIKFQVPVGEKEKNGKLAYQITDHDGSDITGAYLDLKGRKVAKVIIRLSYVYLKNKSFWGVTKKLFKMEMAPPDNVLEEDVDSVQFN